MLDYGRMYTFIWESVKAMQLSSSILIWSNSKLCFSSLSVVMHSTSPLPWSFLHEGMYY